MKFALCALALLAVASATQLKPADNDFVLNEFKLFEQKFNRVYSSQEEREKRFAIFRDNLKEIQEHNLSGSTYKKGVTKFADLTQEEFVSTLNGYVNMYKPSFGVAPARNKDLEDLPEFIDYRDMGAVTPIKDQGSCGSCWAFAAAEMIESYAFLNNNTLVELSPGQLNSCTPNELKCGGSGGCAGSIPQLAFTYSQLFGITTEEEYPYTNGDSGTTEECNYDATTAAAYNMGYETLPRNDYAAVMEHVANVGPVAIAVDASSFGLYSEGIFDGCSYSDNIVINHAIQLIGYGTDEDGNDYWQARNQWGEDWGDNGFIKLKRETETQCGTDTSPLFGTACENDGNTEQYVCGMCAMLYDVSYPVGTYLV